MSGGSVGAVTNSAGGTIAATNTVGSGFLVTGGTVTSLTNNGTIVASGPNGSAISVSNGVVGTIVNGTTGTIIANGVSGTAVNILSAVGGITNQGLISGGAAANGTGISVGPAALVPNITNTATGTIAAAGAGGMGVTIAGSVFNLLNQGQVMANGAGAIGLNVVSGASVGTVTNSGTVQANGTGGTGVLLGGSVTAVNNSGLIQANGTNGTGIGVTGLVTTVTNSGTVQANGTGGMAVNVGSTGLVQTLTNAATGTIAANGPNGVGLNIAAGGAVNTVLNNGTIVASDPTGTGVQVLGALGTLNNNGTIQGGPANGSGTAVILANSASRTTVNNNGSIVGGIMLATSASLANGDTINLNGGTLSGNIQGNFGLNTVNLSGGTIAPGFTIDGVFVTNVNSGVLNTGTGGVAITNGFAVNIAQGATIAMNGGTIGVFSGAPMSGVNPGVNNSGLLNVGTTTGSIVGAYNQLATGQLGIAVTSTGAGSLAVTGPVVINSTGPALALHFTGLTGPSSFIAVTGSGGVTASPFPTASSDSLNPFFDFPVVTQPNVNTLLVSFPTPTVPQLNRLFCLNFCNTGGLTSTGGLNQIAATGGVQGLFDALLVGGDRPNLTNAFVTLRGLSAAQQTQFFTQVQPSQIGAAGALLASALTGNGGLTTAIDDRIYGAAAGDEVGRGLTVWVKPYGGTFTANVKEAVNGFTASGYGVAAGADMMIRPDVRLGGAVSLSNTNFNFNGSQSGNTASDLLFQAGVYAAYFSGNFFIDGIGAFGLHWYNTKENISAFGAQRNSDYNGVQFSTKITGGYDWHAASGMVVTPSLTFQEIHVDSDSHQTSGGGLFNLNVADQHFDVMQLKLGGRVAYPISRPSGWVFTPEAHAYYVRNLILSRVQSTAAFVSGGGAFTVSGPQRDPDLGNVGLGLTIAQKGPLAVSMVYDYTFGQTQSENQFFLRVKTEF